MKHNLFHRFMVAIFVTVLALSTIGTVTPVAAQSNTNVTDWESEAYLADLAAGKVNAIYEPSNPIPVEAPEEVLEALKRGAYLVVVEPWKAGCGGENPVENVNCNVGFVRSFTDWTKMRNFLYGAESEANEGHFGPWTDGSIKVSYIREMTPDEMEVGDWAMYIKGEIRVNFAENKPLPAKDPTNGLVNHALSEPWRHGCDGDSENPNCQVGSSEQGSYQAVLSYLKKGNWTRGSIVAWPKEAVQATAVPSNTPSAPAAGTATAQPTNTVQPASTIEITVYTVTPGAVGTPDEVGEVDAEPTEDVQAALPAGNGSRIWEAIGYCFLGLFFLALLIWFVFFFLPKRVAKQAAAEQARREALAEQPAENAGGDATAEQPAENAGGDAAAERPALRVRRRIE